MSGICRVGDFVVGVCDAHQYRRNFTGVWTQGSGDVSANGAAVIRIGDVGVTDCGHTILAVQGSDSVSANGSGVVRIGDIVIVIEGGTGVTTTGSDDVISS